MRRLTLKEVNEQFGGKLPPDAVLKSDDIESAPAPSKPTLAPRVTPSKAKRSTRSEQSHKPNPVVVKLLGYRTFFEATGTLEPRLHPLAVSLWCWLWTCANDGGAKTSERCLAARFGVGRTSIRQRLRELDAWGFIAVIRKGQRDQSPTHLRVRPHPKKRG